MSVCGNLYFMEWDPKQIPKNGPNEAPNYENLGKTLNFNIR